MSRRRWSPAALRAARIAAGLTQAELARCVGVAGGDRVSCWERGAADPRPVMAGRLARALSVDPDQLYVSDDDGLGVDLAGLRVRASRTSSEVALDAGVTTRTVERWEAGRGVRLPRAEVLERLAGALSCDVAMVEAAFRASRARTPTD